MFLGGFWGVSGVIWGSFWGIFFVEFLCFVVVPRFVPSNLLFWRILGVVEVMWWLAARFFW